MNVAPPTEPPSIPPSSRLVRRLRRETSSGRFIPEIDGLRFICIALVVLFHVAGMVAARSGAAAPASSGDPLLVLVGQGGYGVQLFFVISGFVLALPFARHALLDARAVDLRYYYARRLTRLEPPYIVAMTLFFALALVGIKSVGATGPQLLGHYLAGIFYLHSVVYGRINLINGVAWSLEVEVQFYLLVPLLVRVFRIGSPNRRRGTLIALALVAIALQNLLIPAGSRLSLTLVNQIQFFLMGFLLADIYLTDWREAPTTSRAWDLASLAAWVGLFALWALDRPAQVWHPGPLSNATFPFLAVVAFAAAFRGRITRSILTRPWLTVIGGMCYSIYLLHVPVITFLLRITFPIVHPGVPWLDFVAQSALILPGMIAICGLFYVLIERPCMDRNWPSKLIAWLRGDRPGAVRVESTQPDGTPRRATIESGA